MAEGRTVSRGETGMRGAQRPVICSAPSGNRAPCTLIFEAALSISRRSSARQLDAARRCSPPADAASWCRDRHDPRLLRQQPGERDLGRRRASCVPADLPEQVDQRLVGLPRLRREARHDVAEVGAVELGVLVDLAGEEALAERAEGHEADAEFLERRQHLLASGPRYHSEYSLCSAVTGWTACARRIVCGAGLGQAEVLDLACRDQVLHRAGHVLDRHVRVDAMLIEAGRWRRSAGA